jgi:(1->4)-alpha-D-glucan 1-alpha-D-glucosylmutase
MTQLWRALSGRAADFETEEALARSELLHASFASHLRSTADAFHRLGLFAAREIDEQRLQRALSAVLEHFRAYRTYATGISREPEPGSIFESAVSKAHADIAWEDAEALDFITGVMRGDFAQFGQVAWRAARRFNQLGAPVAAKAVEDTAFFATGGCCRATMSASRRAFSRIRNPISKRARDGGLPAFRTHFWRQQRTITSAARTCGRVWLC